MLLILAPHDHLHNKQKSASVTCTGPPIGAADTALMITGCWTVDRVADGDGPLCCPRGAFLTVYRAGVSIPLTVG